jgi:hypothetical protein
MCYGHVHWAATHWKSAVVVASVAPHMAVQAAVAPPPSMQPTKQRQLLSPAQAVTAGQHFCLVHSWQALSPGIAEQTVVPELEDADEDEEVGVEPQIGPQWALTHAL